MHLTYWVNTEFEQRYEDAMNSVMSTGSATMLIGNTELTVDFRGE